MLAGLLGAAFCFLIACLPGRVYSLGRFGWRREDAAFRLPQWLGRLLFVLAGMWELYLGLFGWPSHL